MKYKDRYETILTEEDGVLIFQFTSKGIRKILKAIEFRPQVYELYRRSVYNLLFGDYKDESRRLRDFDLSDNGDVYRVFHTVLSVIPLFFMYRPHSAILVQGSDSMQGLFRTCIYSCQKGCTHVCKNEGRRIRIYRTFLNKYYNQLSDTYAFIGAIRSEAGRHYYFTDYSPGKVYDEILLYKK